MNRFLIATSVLLFAAVPALAAEPAVDCDKATSTPELNQCADAALQAADAKLNAMYQKALVVIRKAGGEKPYDRKSWEDALKVSQRAWLAYRDADCDGLVPMSWGGGTGTTSAVLWCKTEKTETRTKELALTAETD
jgi:uncharacterized protein YecT (DUF1311 family)